MIKLTIASRRATQKILNKYTGRLARYTLVLAIATVVTMAGTIWIAYSTKELRDFAQQQALDVRAQVEATNEALKVAQVQSTAAIAANDIAKTALFNSTDGMRKQIRAYIFFTDKEFFDELQPSMAMTLAMRNFGNTPAHDVQFELQIKFVEFPFGESGIPELLVFEKPARQDYSAAVMAPQEPWSLKVYATQADAQKAMKEFQNNKRALLIQAVVNYQDIYGDRHATALCKIKPHDDKQIWKPDQFCSKFNYSY
jgi:cell division protein FtsL